VQQCLVDRGMVDAVAVVHTELDAVAEGDEEEENANGDTQAAVEGEHEGCDYDGGVVVSPTDIEGLGWRSPGDETEYGTARDE
jgi:hypothetical protein